MRPARCPSSTSSRIRASTIGVRPAAIISTFMALTSTPMTLCPKSAKQAADTEPTYPIPNTLIDRPTLPLLKNVLNENKTAVCQLNHCSVDYLGFTVSTPAVQL